MSETEELRSEIQFLRELLDDVINESGMTWSDVLTQIVHDPKPLWELKDWFQRYVSVVLTAAQQEDLDNRPTVVFSRLSDG